MKAFFFNAPFVIIQGHEGLYSFTDIFHGAENAAGDFNTQFAGQASTVSPAEPLLFFVVIYNLLGYRGFTPNQCPRKLMPLQKNTVDN